MVVDAAQDNVLDSSLQVLSVDTVCLTRLALLLSVGVGTVMSMCSAASTGISTEGMSALLAEE